ncbi:transglutaminase domain protein [Solidesulfovibrio fructosivorans JJ]]|uniref:Transglutaminase domain protein n=1 Tax=Solidesulfovibrio fructosivorans JJ] TaxID=596151 RepID=E1JS48_SOLFR|nr:transglutaminase domain-containing protein [Solidesulfovibrio fructosivorans]EFL52817.1 transglutaminase domain protein [Solidesulfovibrio fructosivorans JJ]]
MSSLERYILTMEAVEEENLTASGLAAFQCNVAGTGTCGVVTAADGIPLPRPEIAASGDWRPAASLSLTGLAVLATTDGWRPAWGGGSLPVPGITGQASLARKARATLTPLFGLGLAGACGEAALPAMAAYGLDATSARMASGAATLPALAAHAYLCGLDSPVTSRAGSAAVVGLLCLNDPELATVAASLADASTGWDVLAGAMLAAVARRVAYVADGDDADVWNCALGTAFRGCGDCEDGAILLHALLLAAGVPADRLVTAFGRVGIDREGHSWVGYRRVTDGRWVALDWTRGASQGAVAGLPVLGAAAYYAVVDYALTAGSFFTVRQDAAVFFARATADAVALPAAALDASGTFGGNASLEVPSGRMRCRAGAGARGSARIPHPTVSGSAGSVQAGVTLPAAALGAACGGKARLAPSLPEIAAQAGGGAAAAMRFGRARSAGAARTGVLVAGRVAMPLWRNLGHGEAGRVARALCLLPRPRCAAGGTPGSLAPGGLSLPVPEALAEGREIAIVQAMLQAAALGARGLARPGDAILESCPCDAAVGEEW